MQTFRRGIRNEVYIFCTVHSSFRLFDFSGMLFYSNTEKNQVA